MQVERAMGKVCHNACTRWISFNWNPSHERCNLLVFKSYCHANNTAASHFATKTRAFKYCAKQPLVWFTCDIFVWRFLIPIFLNEFEVIVLFTHSFWLRKAYTHTMLTSLFFLSEFEFLPSSVSHLTFLQADQVTEISDHFAKITVQDLVYWIAFLFVCNYCDFVQTVHRGGALSFIYYISSCCWIMC